MTTLIHSVTWKPPGGPPAPHAHTVQIVNVEPPRSWCWRVEMNGQPVCDLDLQFSLRHPWSNTFMILDRNLTEAQRAQGFLGPIFIGEGKFNPCSVWWTLEVAHDVLRAIVHACIAPNALNITIAGEQPGTREDLERVP